MPPLTESSVRKLLFALAIYLTSLIASNTLGLKIMPFILGTHLSVGVFMFPVVFLGTDVIGEVYGKKIAKYFVYAGFIATLLFIAYNLISAATPWASEGLWVKDAYNTVFGISLRISIASVIAFAIGEYQDVVAFFFAKQRFASMRFWSRSFIASLWSQFFDTVIFMIVAFYGVYPNHVLISIIFTWWLFKVGMSLLYTPLAYAGVWFLKDHAGTAD
jgi:hypothetical protein